MPVPRTWLAPEAKSTSSATIVIAPPLAWVVIAPCDSVSSASRPASCTSIAPLLVSSPLPTSSRLSASRTLMSASAPVPVLSTDSCAICVFSVPLRPADLSDSSASAALKCAPLTSMTPAASTARSVRPQSSAAVVTMRVVAPRSLTSTRSRLSSKLIVRAPYTSWCAPSVSTSPTPEVTVSSTRWSSPAPPTRFSTPVGPTFSVSLPSPASTVLVPWSMRIVSLPPAPKMVLVPLPMSMMSSPCPPTNLSSPASP